MKWNERCRESIRKEKKEIELRYEVKIGQTDIYCAKCRRPWGYGRHICPDIRFKQLNEAKKDVIVSQTEFVD